MADTSDQAPARVAADPDGQGPWLPVLQRLDSLLQPALVAAAARFGSHGDPFRGLHLGPAEVEQLLAREPGAPLLAVPTAGAGPAAGRLAWLAERFGLDPFELDLLVIALAPELDLRYERLYAYLQDDVSHRRPMVDLALNLLCATAAEKLVRRAHLHPDAPLLANHLLALRAPEPNAPLISHTIALDPQIVDVLLAQGGLDRRLTGFCRLTTPYADLNALPLAQPTREQLVACCAHASPARPLRLYLQGAPGSGRRPLAAALATRLEAPLLLADLDAAPAEPASFAEALRVCLREAWLQGALLLLEGLDGLAGDERRQRALRDLLVRHPGPLALAGGEPWQPGGATGVVTIELPVPPAALRRQCWEDGLLAEGVALEPDELDALAGRFRLNGGQIAGAIAEGVGLAGLRGGGEPELGELFAAARGQSGRRLAALARKLAPAHSWADLVLPDDELAQLRELCACAEAREQVLEGWGFAAHGGRGRGISALFAGPSGTGKTMAAEVIAGTLGLDLYAIDLAGVVSKYIGETEKNLDRIFRAAEDANALLFFDEADALFGKRSEVKDSHDRYANIEVSYLLQRIEQYDGVAILATNLRQQLDEAFLRRLSFSVSFPFPDEAMRRRIWATIWPAGARLAPDLDLGWMAASFRLSGGNIRNIALQAAFLAAGDGGVVHMAHLRHATRREYQKLGKALSEADLAVGMA